MWKWIAPEVSSWILMPSARSLTQHVVNFLQALEDTTCQPLVLFGSFWLELIHGVENAVPLCFSWCSCHQLATCHWGWSPHEGHCLYLNHLNRIWTWKEFKRTQSTRSEGPTACSYSVPHAWTNSWRSWSQHDYIPWREVMSCPSQLTQILLPPMARLGALLVASFLSNDVVVDRKSSVFCLLH
jgi:hypothetical protein